MFAQINVRAPKIQMALALFLLFCTAVLHNQTILAAQNFLIILGTCILAEYVFLRIRGISFFLPSAAIVTGLIIGLLAAPDLPIIALILTSLLALFSKNFIRISSRHVFNPAGFGLLTTSVLFNKPVSWWGVSFQQFNPTNILLFLFFVVLLSPGLISMVRMRRYRITFPFLIIYTLLNILINHGAITNFLLDPTVLFFAFVMLPEPMTTPNKPTRQLVFGLLIGIMSLFVSTPQVLNGFDPLIFALLIGNMLFLKMR